MTFRLWRCFSLIGNCCYNKQWAVKVWSWSWMIVFWEKSIEWSFQIKASLHPPTPPNPSPPLPPPSQWPGMGSKRSGAGLARLHHLPSAVSVQYNSIQIFFANVQGRKLTFILPLVLGAFLLFKTDCGLSCHVPLHWIVALRSGRSCIPWYGFFASALVLIEWCAVISEVITF